MGLKYRNEIMVNQTLEAGKMDVFISYGEHGGAHYAEHLKDGLKKMGLTAFVAKRDIPVGSKWKEIINKAIDDCENFVVILTADACVSEYVSYEITRAKDGDKIIIPCKHERLDKNEIPGNIGELHEIDFENEYELFSNVWYVIRPNVPIPTIIKDSMDSIVEAFKIFVPDGDGGPEEIFVPDSLENYLPSAEIKDIWHEHAVWEDNSKGMRIHVSFDINNLKGVNCQAVAYFYFESGKTIKDFNQRYSTTDGQVASGIDFEPRYVNSTYSDFCIFLPYPELHIRKPGKYNLKFKISIWNEDTELDQSWMDFTYFR